MALSAFALEVMRGSLADRVAATELQTLLETHAGGTLSQYTKNILRNFFGSRSDATAFITAVEASTALAATLQAKLGQALGNHSVAAAIEAELVA